MYVNEENRIEIEKWVFFAIALGLLEVQSLLHNVLASLLLT
jgi:hypothetical protein